MDIDRIEKQLIKMNTSIERMIQIQQRLIRMLLVESAERKKTESEPQSFGEAMENLIKASARIGSTGLYNGQESEK